MANQHFVGELPAALRLIDQRLKEYKERNKLATLVVLQSSTSAEHFQISGIPTLLGEFPVLKLAPSAHDSDFPALEWIKFACKRTVATQSEAIATV